MGAVGLKIEGVNVGTSGVPEGAMPHVVGACTAGQELMREVAIVLGAGSGVDICKAAQVAALLKGALKSAKEISSGEGRGGPLEG